MGSKKNVVILAILCIIGGIFIGYFYKNTKIETKIVSSQADKDTISELQKQLKKKTRIVVKYKDGVIESSTTDTDTTIDTNSNIKENEKISQKSSEKVEINPKKYIIEAGYATNNNYYAHTIIPIFSVFSIGGHFSSNFISDTSVGLGLGISF